MNIGRFLCHLLLKKNQTASRFLRLHRNTERDNHTSDDNDNDKNAITYMSPRERRDSPETGVLQLVKTQLIKKAVKGVKQQKIKRQPNEGCFF